MRYYVGPVLINIGPSQVRILSRNSLYLVIYIIQLRINLDCPSHNLAIIVKSEEMRCRHLSLIIFGLNRSSKCRYSPLSFGMSPLVYKTFKWALTISSENLIVSRAKLNSFERKWGLRVNGLNGKQSTNNQIRNKAATQSTYKAGTY